VYQICKCFRNGESEGHLHSSEFTMLEYYTMNADYMASLAITEELIANLVEKLLENMEWGAINSQFSAPHFLRITVAEAFKRWAGFDLFEAANKNGAMEKEARRLGLEPPSGMTVPELYDLIFIHAVEPNLKTEAPVFLLDYPAFVPCLAKNKGQTVERWELYWNGIELANCFSEETDPQRVREFFVNEEAAKEKSALVRHKVDRDYWKMFEGERFPICSGVAMGVDRLIMALTGKGRIDGVIHS